jgi:hypothetical protein
MKFVIKFIIRRSGLTFEECLAHDHALLAAFSKWTPPEGFTIQQFVTTLVNDCGYLIVEASDSAVILSALSKFRFFDDFEIIPVVDVNPDLVVTLNESIAWTRDAATTS